MIALVDRLGLLSVTTVLLLIWITIPCPLLGRGRGQDAGYPPFRGRGRGRIMRATDKRGAPGISPSLPLSSLHYSERPMLRPITFVRAIHTPVLFQEKEDILMQVNEGTGGSLLFLEIYLVL